MTSATGVIFFIKAGCSCHSFIAINTCCHYWSQIFFIIRLKTPDHFHPTIISREYDAITLRKYAFQDWRFNSKEKSKFRKVTFSQIHGLILRTTGPIILLLVLISKSLSMWIQIWQWQFNFFQSFEKVWHVVCSGYQC